VFVCLCFILCFFKIKLSCWCWLSWLDLMFLWKFISNFDYFVRRCCVFNLCNWGSTKCICMHVHLCVCVCIHACTVYAYICMCRCIHKLYVYARAGANMCIHICVCIVCVCVPIHVYAVHMYTNKKSIHTRV